MPESDGTARLSQPRWCTRSHSRCLLEDLPRTRTYERQRMVQANLVFLNSLAIPELLQLHYQQMCSLRLLHLIGSDVTTGQH